MEGRTVSTCLDQGIQGQPRGKTHPPIDRDGSLTPVSLTHRTLCVPASISTSPCTSSCVCQCGPEYAKQLPISMLKSRKAEETSATKEHISDLKASLTPHRYNTLCAPASASTSASSPSCVLREWPGTSRATALQLIAALGYCEGGTVSTCLDQGKPGTTACRDGSLTPISLTHRTLCALCLLGFALFPACANAARNMHSECQRACLSREAKRISQPKKHISDLQAPLAVTRSAPQPLLPLQLSILPASRELGFCQGVQLAHV